MTEHRAAKAMTQLVTACIAQPQRAASRPARTHVINEDQRPQEQGTLVARGCACVRCCGGLAPRCTRPRRPGRLCCRREGETRHPGLHRLRGRSRADGRRSRAILAVPAAIAHAEAQQAAAVPCALVKARLNTCPAALSRAVQPRVDAVAHEGRVLGIAPAFRAKQVGVGHSAPPLVAITPVVVARLALVVCAGAVKGEGQCSWKRHIEPLPHRGDGLAGLSWSRTAPPPASSRARRCRCRNTCQNYHRTRLQSAFGQRSGCRRGRALGERTCAECCKPLAEFDPISFESRRRLAVSRLPQLTGRSSPASGAEAVACVVVAAATAAAVFHTGFATTRVSAPRQRLLRHRGAKAC